MTTLCGPSPCPPPPPLDAQGRLAVDVPCFKCAYNLRGLTAAPAPGSAQAGPEPVPGAKVRVSPGTTPVAATVLVLFLCGVIEAAPASKPPTPPRAAPAPAATRIMCLGDSITQADAQHASFRPWLGKWLRDSGYRVDLVGSQNEHQGGKSPVKDRGFDPDHEGHWGWRTDQVLAQVEVLATKAKPQIVMIHLGTEDLLAKPPTTVPAPTEFVPLPDPSGGGVANLGKIIDALRKQNPTVHVQLAQIIPIAGREPQVAAFNKALYELAKRKSTAKSLVLAVDQNTGFDAAKLLYDGVHPNEAGEKLIAERFFVGVQMLLDKQYPLTSKAMAGRLTPFNNFLRTSNYGGITGELDETMGGGGLSPFELEQAVQLLDDVAAYAQAQRDRVRVLQEADRYAEAGPLVELLTKQFRAAPLGREMTALKLIWHTDPKVLKELEAGPVLARAKQAHLRQNWAQAGQLYGEVMSKHARTQAAAEAKQLLDDLVKRGVAAR